MTGCHDIMSLTEGLDTGQSYFTYPAV